jgi:GH24 family phage-related lysozyme (muramidase)
MNIDKALAIAVEHSKKWEGLASKSPSKTIMLSRTSSPDTLVYAYPDGKGFSIGWGSYGSLSDGTKVTKGMSITKERADQEILWEYKQKEAQVRSKINPSRLNALNEAQYAAILDTAYNAGVGSLSYNSNIKGDKFTSILDAVNAGQDITDILPKVAISDSATGKVSSHLVKRRKDAAQLWNGHYDSLYQIYLRNADTVNYAVIGVVIIALTGYVWYLKKRKVI